MKRDLNEVTQINLEISSIEKQQVNLESANQTTSDSTDLMIEVCDLEIKRDKILRKYMQGRLKVMLESKIIATSAKKKELLKPA